MKENLTKKITFSGIIKSVQPRSNVWRYRLDNRTHGMTGYNLFLEGTADCRDGAFAVAISEKQQMKHKFHIGDEIKGTCWTKKYPKWEYADYYRAGALKKVKAGHEITDNEGLPWKSEVPELSVYEWRGCRMLDKARWRNRCFKCKWACMANVAIEYDWGVTQKYRFESFCYGPKNCKLYQMGKPRPVPYKDSWTDYDDGWIDEICTQNRNDEE